MLELVERHSTSKARLRRLLAEAAALGWCEESVYMARPTLDAVESARGIIRSRTAYDMAQRVILDAVGDTDTGVAMFIGQDRALAVCPPFPLSADSTCYGLDAAPLLSLLDAEYTVGIVMLRLGRYAVCALRGERILASKTESRYMKNRHRAGGQSQRRFERSRERLIRELYDKTCETASKVFSPFAIDYILLGGENSTLNGFTDRCRLMRDLSDKTLTRRLAIDQPNKKTIDNIAFEAWKSRVYTFQSV